MAKGNDGNLLQHGIEAEIAVQLAIDNSLYLVCTHGMEPYERWQNNPTRNNRLVYWIEYSPHQERNGEPAIVRAYRALHASHERYPNTGEIIASLLKREKLTGFISEVCPEKLRSLRQAWSSTGVLTLLGSWRQHLGAFQEAPPDRPWLFTMDPMTFCPDQSAKDDDRLYPSDLHCRLRPVWERFLATGQPGAISLFSFELMHAPGPNRYQLFLDHTRAIASNLQIAIETFEVAYGSNPHVGAVLTKDEELLRHLRSCWKRLHAADRGRESGL